MRLPRRQFLHLAAGAAALPAPRASLGRKPIRSGQLRLSIPFRRAVAPASSRGSSPISSPRHLASKSSLTNAPEREGRLLPSKSPEARPTDTRLCWDTPERLALPESHPNAGYDPRKDFAPVGRIGMAPNSLVVHPSFPVRSVAELIAYAKQNPGKVNFGSAEIGTVGHVAGELLASMAGIKLAHVPYRGTGPNLTDLLGGHIPMSFAPIPATYENTKNGLLRMLGVIAPCSSARVSCARI